MIWYFFIALLMLYPLALKIRAERSGFQARGLVLLVSCAILFFFFALRGERVGVDTKYYCRVFRQFLDIPLRDVFRAATYGSDARTWTFDFEPGFRLFNKLLTYLSGHPQTITIATAVLIFVPLFAFVYQASANVWLSMWLFLTLGIFQTDMNVSRNAIAIFLCYLALPLIERRRPVPYVLIVLLASTIHQTALLFLPVYLLIRFVPLNPRRALGIFLAALFIGLNFTVFGRALQGVVPERYAKYFGAGNEKLVSLIVGVFNAVVAGLAVLLLRKEERRGLIESNQTGSWILLLNISFFAVDLGFSAGARAAALFGPYLIVLIPNILERIRSENRRKAAAFLVAAFCFLQYAARMQINNIGGSIPFYFYWQT